MIVSKQRSIALTKISRVPLAIPGEITQNYISGTPILT